MKQLKEKKQIKEKDAIKASFWYLISNMVLKGLGFLTVPIFSRMLSKSEFGYYNNFTAWLSILTIIATLSLSTSLVRARFEFREDLNCYVTSNLILGSIGVIVFFVIFLFNKSVIERVFALDFKYIVIMFLSILFLPAYNMFQQLQRFDYKYKIVVTMTLGVSIGSILLSLCLMKYMNNRLEARIIGAQLPFFIISLILYVYFLFKSRKVKMKYWKYSLMICLPFLVHLLSGNVLTSVDRTMITGMCGAESTALYGMAYNIAMVVTVLWDSLNTAYSPWLGEQLNNKNYEGIRRYSYGYILFFFVCLVGVMLIAPEALYILGGKPYIEAKYVIPPVMLGYGFMFLYSMYANVEQFEKKTTGMAVATVMAALLNLGLNYIFIPKFGYLAAAYTTLVGYLFLFIFHYVLVRKMGFHTIYDTRFILLVSLTSTVIAVLILVVYQLDFIRYIVLSLYILIMGILGWKNRKMILGLIKK